MPKPKLIFEACTKTDTHCSCCQRLTKQSTAYVAIYRHGRTDAAHYLICERCIDALGRVVAQGGKLRRAMGRSPLPMGEL